MDLFKLLGTIAIDNSEANKALDETSAQGQKTEGKLSSAFSKMGQGAVKVGKAIGTGIMAAGAAVTGLVTMSTSAYAQYEQLVGGVETLFKESADAVLGYANNAYQTAGMSANAYMETVTSFAASLLQSLDGDTAAAAEKADMAIRDMSDNANKMGTTIDMIQNAYQGFAKQNYTMLDNLKLGYGGTKEEMARLLADAEKISGIKYDISSYGDIVDAIHVIQTEMGITGTTAAEAAGTISGSMASVGAAWQNLTRAIADDNADFGAYVNQFVESISAAAENMLPRIGIALNGVVQLIDQLAPVIFEKVPALLSQLLPTVISAATSLVNAVAEALPDAVTAITTALPSLIDGIATVVNGIVAALPSVLEAILSALPSVLTSLVEGLKSVFANLCTTLPNLIQPLLAAIPNLAVLVVETILGALPVLFGGLSTLVTSLLTMLPQLVPLFMNAIMGIVNMLVTQLPIIIPQLINALIQIVVLLGQQLPVLIPEIVNGLIQIITMLVMALPTLLPVLQQAMLQLITSIITLIPVLIPAIMECLTSLIQMLVELLPVLLPLIIEGALSMSIALINAIIEALPDILVALVGALPELLAAVWDAIVMVFTNLPEWFGALFKSATDLSAATFSPLGTFFSGISETLKATITILCEFIKMSFKNAWEGIKLVFSVSVDFFRTLWENIKLIFSVVKDVFTGNFRGAWDGIKQVFSNWGEFFGGLWDKIKNTFSKIGTNIGDAMTKAIRAGINGLIGAAETTINGFLKMINGAIDLINKIPGVSISKVKLVSFTKLAEGGVVDKPTPAVFGEDGAEAVVPLENNQGWLKKVAANLHSFMIDTNNQGNPLYGYAGQATKEQAISAAIQSDVALLKETLEGIFETLDAYLPDIRERMEYPVPAVVGVDQAADALVEPINYRLGRISAMKGRGR